MKAICILVFLLLASGWLQAQNDAKGDTIVPAKGNIKSQLQEIKKEKVALHSDSTGSEPKKSVLVDTTMQNKYGDLLNDDSLYNKKYPAWKPAVEVFGSNLVVFSADRYLFKFPYSTEVGINSWKHNIRTGWEWDRDRFGINRIVRNGDVVGSWCGGGHVSSVGVCGPVALSHNVECPEGHIDGGTAEGRVRPRGDSMPRR